MIRSIIILLVSLVITACAPATFVRNAPGWTMIEIKNGLTTDQVWGKVADSIKERDLEFEKVDKEVGYMRTTWNYEISKSTHYATRIIVDFPSNGKVLKVKTEALYCDRYGCNEGFDSKYDQTFKSELTALISQK
jgi:hypothetical protein